jgi:hypothetical protein
MAEPGPGHQGVAEPGDLQPRRSAEQLLEVVGYRRLVVADRGYGNELGGEPEQVAGDRFGEVRFDVDQQTLSQQPSNAERPSRQRIAGK